MQLNSSGFRDTWIKCSIQCRRSLSAVQSRLHSSILRRKPLHFDRITAMDIQCTSGCINQARILSVPRLPQVIRRLCRQSKALNRHDFASRMDAWQLLSPLRRPCSAAAVKVSSQASHAVNEEKEAMQAAMAKAKAGQTSEGQPHTAVQQVVPTIRQCNKCCAFDSHALSLPVTTALLAGSVFWRQPCFPCSPFSSR